MAKLNISIGGKIEGSLTSSLKSLNESMKQLVAMNKQVADSLDKMSTKTRGSGQTVTAAAGSYREAQRALTAMGKSIREAENGFNSNDPAVKRNIAAYRALSEQLKAFDREMGLNYRNVGNYNSAIGTLTTSITSLVGSYISLQTAIQIVSSVVSANRQIADSASDVQRTAELTKNELIGLFKELKKIPSRTGLSELSEIATIGGQLGIAKDELAGFVEAVDMLAVTLKNEIAGGAEAVTEALGKINGVFGVAEKNGLSAGDAMQKTGSAILALGQAGLATGEFMVDFTQRVGGAAKTTGMALPTILAYGAVLEEAGVSAEVAGTAISKLIGQIAVKRNEFYAIAQLADANLTLQDFTNLINTDADQALRKFLAGLQAGGKTTTDFYDVMKTAGINTERYKNAVLLLAQDQEKLTTLTELSTESFNKGSLAVEQFALRNSNLSAVLDRVARDIKESFIDLEVSQSVADWIAKTIGLTSESKILERQLLELRSAGISQEEQINSLVTKYTSLKNQVLLNKGGNEELKQVIQQIVDIFPLAATSIDKYGQAIDVNIFKVKELSESHKELIKDMNITTFKNLNKEFDSASKNAGVFKEDIDKMVKAGIDSFGWFSKHSGIGLRKANMDSAREQLARFNLKALESAQAIKALGFELTQAQKDLIAFYEPINKDAKSADIVPKTATNDVKQAIGIVKNLQDQIKALRDEQPDIVDSKALAENVKQIKALENELNNILGRNDKRSEKHAKEEERRQDAITRSIERQNDIREKANIHTLDNDPIAKIEDEYRKMGRANAEEYQKQLENGLNPEKALENFNRALDALSTGRMAKIGQIQAEQLKKETEEAIKAIPDAQLTLERRNNKDIVTLLKNRLNEEYRERLKSLNKEKQAGKKNKEQMLEEEKKLQLSYWKDIESISQIEELNKVGIFGFGKAMKQAEAEFKKSISSINVGTREGQAEVDRLIQLWDRFQYLLKKDVENKALDTVSSIGGEIKNIIDSFSSFDQGLGQSMIALAGIANSISNVTKTISDAVTKVGEGVKEAGKASGSAILAIVGAVVEIIGTIYSAIEAGVKRRDKELVDRLNAVKDFNNAQIQGERDYQALLRQRAKEEAYGKGGYSGTKNALAEELKNISKLEKEYSKLFDILQKGSYISEKTATESKNNLFWLGIGNKTKFSFKEVIESLKGADFNKLEELYSKGMLVGDEKMNFENLRELRKELEETGKSIEDLELALDQMLTGTTVESLAAGFVDLFAQGKTSAKDMAEYTEEVIKNAIKSTAIAKYATEFMQPLFDELASQMKSETFDISKIQDLARTGGENINKFLSALEQATGISLFDPLKEFSSGISGQISRAITEDTALRLEGIWRGMFEMLKLGNEYTKQLLTHIGAITSGSERDYNTMMMSVMNSIDENTLRTADNTDLLIDIDETLENIRLGINKVASNTDQQTIRDLGL